MKKNKEFKQTKPLWENCSHPFLKLYESHTSGNGEVLAVYKCERCGLLVKQWIKEI